MMTFIVTSTITNFAMYNFAIGFGTGILVIMVSFIFKISFEYADNGRKE